MPEPPPPALGIILASADHARIHAALMLAAGAAALGRAVTLFAMGQGVHALRADLPQNPADPLLHQRGVADIPTLREACTELGVTLLACDSGLRAESLPPTSLLPQVREGGMAEFLATTRNAQLVSF